MTSFRTILHPTDFSDNARQAFRLACTIAGAHGSRLIVLHVHLTAGPLLAFGAAMVQLETSNHQEKLLKVLRRFRVSNPVVCIEHQLVTGDPVTQILRVAYKYQCDLIVMGTRGTRGMPRSPISSVAECIMRKAECPVLSVEVPHHIAGAENTLDELSFATGDGLLSKGK